jgi:hypothetical protein
VRKALVGLAIGAVTLTGATPGLAEDIFKWTDEQGRTHYSNRGGTPADDSSPRDGASGEQGWESVLEKQKGTENFQEKAEAAINSLQLQVTRKKRDRTLAQEQLEATQASIVRAQSTNTAELPALRAREATQITNLRRIELEINSMELNGAKLRALKAAENEQRSGR